MGSGKGTAALVFVCALLRTAVSLSTVSLSTEPPCSDESPSVVASARVRSNSCDCEGAVLLERQRLEAEYAISLQAMREMYTSRITELEVVVAALGSGSIAAARQGATHRDLLPLVADFVADARTATGPSRALLQSE